LEARAAAEEQKRRELEARIAAEEQRRKELEAHLAAEEERMKQEIARREEERRRKELESRVLAEEQVRKDLEARVAIEEKRRQELEKRVSLEESRKREIEERIYQEERRRKEFEELAAGEERLRKQIEEKMIEALHRKDLETRAAEDHHRIEELRRQEEMRAAQELHQKELAARAAREQQKLEEMRHQIEELTKALEAEKNAREEITRLNLQNSVKQLRSALEASWVNGAPVDAAASALHELATSLQIPPEVEQSLIRQVKLDMYSKAVKEVIAKKRLLRSSSSTLEWLRKVYQVSVSEYLENESKFLLDLIADQYKGTVLLISKTIGTKEDITQRLKTSGFAVVQAATPEDALEKIEKVNPNVVVCDTDFPGGLSGVRFLHVIRANSKFNYIPFILIGEVTEIAQLKSSELKPNEGVIKRPIDYEELTTLINEKLSSFREYISSLK
jgi:chemotaxis protein histidine kinase CheA